jgi:hypothetical protein
MLEYKNLRETPHWYDAQCYVQGGSNMTGTNCDLFTHNQSRSYLNHLVYGCVYFDRICVRQKVKLSRYRSGRALGVPGG